MKRSFFFPVLLCIMAAGCESTRPMTTATTTTDADGNTVTYITAPAALQTSFTTRYPGATNARWSNYDSRYAPVDWELTDWQALNSKDYTVSYDMDGNKYYSWYNANGDWIGSSYGMTNYNGLPASVNSAISSRYPGYTISGVQNEFWRDRNAYQIELKNGNSKTKLLIDANGNVLKEKTKMK